jgi:hypothetical protein
MKSRRGVMGAHETREYLVSWSAAQHTHVGGRGQWHSDAELAFVPHENDLISEVGGAGPS